MLRFGVDDIVIIYFLIVCVYNCISYEQYQLSSDKICSLVDKKRKIRLKRGEESSAVVKETRSFDDWLGVVVYRCRYEIKSGDGDGVIAVIQNLYFRSDESGCIDYVQFRKENGEKSRKYCGHINAFKHLEGGKVQDDESYNSFYDPRGELDTTIHVANKRLQDNENLDLEIVYTTYRACQKGPVNYETCGPYVSDLCIWKELFNDGYVNCPRNCFDEGSCYRAVEVPEGSDVSTKVTIGAVTTILLALILFITCLWILKRHKKLCWSNDCSGRPRPSASPAVMMEMNSQMQNDMRSPAIPSAPLGESTSVTVSDDKDLPPPYESLFPDR